LLVFRQHHLKPGFYQGMIGDSSQAIAVESARVWVSLISLVAPLPVPPPVADPGFLMKF
jgi:hypothetical protein